MKARKPCVAGQFYPAEKKSCRKQIKECLAAEPSGVKLPSDIVCGIVPHAGWVFSGSLAAMVFSAIKKVCGKVDTFVIFGAVHSFYGSYAAVYDNGAWETPLGQIEIDEQLGRAVIEKCESAKADNGAHQFEHSIEVQVPFVQYLFEGTKIVPIMVPPGSFDERLGKYVADCIKESAGKKIVCVGSTDLTHYGPRYGFCPQGTGDDAIRWAKEINDMGFIDRALELKSHQMLTAAMEDESACGPGAAAAVITVAKELGREKGVLLAHTHSNEVMMERYNQSSAESVGYAAIVF